MPHTPLQYKMPGPQGLSLGSPFDPHKTAESSCDLVSESLKAQDLHKCSSSQQG